jgi:myo-inositol-1(or 4)-monophosphatase
MEAMSLQPPSRAPSSAAPALAADWLGVCRRTVAAQRAIFDAVRGVEARTVYEGIGEGGDHALAIDRRCEDAVFAELQAVAAAGLAFQVISEERGEVAFGPASDLRLVIDPIDGSLNARRTIPSHSFSFAVASGPTMADVEFGYVYDFGADEEFVASSGEGAVLGDQPLVADQNDGLEVVGIEAAKPELTLPVVEALQGEVYRLRGIGSIAITVSYVAAGRLDGMVSLRPCRSVDAAAAQLIVREAGGQVAFGDLGLDQAGLGIDARYPIAAAATESGLRTLLAAQAAGQGG